MATMQVIKNGVYEKNGELPKNGGINTLCTLCPPVGSHYNCAWNAVTNYPKTCGFY